MPTPECVMRPRQRLAPRRVSDAKTTYQLRMIGQRTLRGSQAQSGCEPALRAAGSLASSEARIKPGSVSEAVLHSLDVGNSSAVIPASAEPIADTSPQPRIPGRTVIVR